ncbi:polysaccharide biosynthesis tyrosine autokinase [Micromonospora sp. A200]|uniref:polysaccharide biosynthesis tyrosine autokinase n=1 Tax=Micromonospora sp. A200 TaxID=2940568 RepID=UPI002474A0ED|nr:polysaccharide biosynthesis tyrosine autokinase [Micromonospora sp. A200]
MDITQYLRALRAHWFLVVLMTALGGAAAGVYSWVQTPMYQADVQLFVSISSTDAGAADLNQGGTFAQQRVKSYVDIVDSPTVTNAVLQSLQLPYTADELAEKITAASPPNTVLLNISVTDPSPQMARDIADAVASQVSKFIVDLETPTGATTSPVKAAITKSASLPTAPVSPRTNLNLALGLLVGLASGAGLAVLRHTLDKTIHGRREAALVAGAAVVGEIGDDPKTKVRGLIVDDPTGLRAEEFRRLRTNIRFLSIDGRIGSLVVTGSVPGEGKSTVAANMAIALAQSGERVVLIDGDLRKSRVATLFGLPGGVGLTSVLVGDVPIEAAMHHWRRELPLYVVTSGPTPPNPSELLGTRRLADLVAGLVASGMTVIFDAPPLLPVTDAAVLARATDGALVVTRVGSTKADELATSIEALRDVDARILGVVANRVKRKNKDGYYADQSSGWTGAAAAKAAQAVMAPPNTDRAPAAKVAPQQGRATPPPPARHQQRPAAGR